MEFIKKFLEGLLTLLIVLVIIYGIVYVPALFGYHNLIIESDYMEPVYSKGCIVFYQDVNPKQIVNGDIITIKKNDEIKSCVVVSVDNDKYKVKYNGKEEEIYANSIVGKNINIVILFFISYKFSVYLYI